jgi:hypothetical protein
MEPKDRESTVQRQTAKVKYIHAPEARVLSNKKNMDFNLAVQHVGVRSLSLAAYRVPAPWYVAETAVESQRDHHNQPTTERTDLD